MSRNVTLRFMSGSRDGAAIQVPAGGDPAAVVFGRLPTCDVCLADDLDVSRRHARLIWKDGWWLEDLKSSNGSFLGEFKHSRRIFEPVLLSAGQIFMLGHTRFRLEAEKAARVPFVLQARAEKE